MALVVDAGQRLGEVESGRALGGRGGAAAACERARDLCLVGLRYAADRDICSRGHRRRAQVQRRGDARRGDRRSWHRGGSRRARRRRGRTVAVCWSRLRKAPTCWSSSSAATAASPGFCWVGRASSAPRPREWPPGDVVRGWLASLGRRFESRTCLQALEPELISQGRRFEPFAAHSSGLTTRQRFVCVRALPPTAPAEAAVAAAARAAAKGRSVQTCGRARKARPLRVGGHTPQLELGSRARRLLATVPA